MRISLTLAEAEALAAQYYSGASQPLTKPKAGHKPLDCEWWRTPRKVEQFNSGRHKGALNLYLAIARHSPVPLPEFSFPSSFDFAEGTARTPDKGFVKMCLNAEPPVTSCRMISGHLVFSLTPVGRSLLETS